MPFAVTALVLSAVAAAGSLYLSLGMGLRACPLCFYQRAFALGLVGVLLTGLVALRDRPGRLCLLALPLAVGGLGVAAFHVYLGMTGWPRAGETWYLACPLGVAGAGTAPQQSLVAFALVVLALVAGANREVRAGTSGGAVVVGLLLGAGAAVGSVVANPPMPPIGPLPATIETCVRVSKG